MSSHHLWWDEADIQDTSNSNSEELMDIIRPRGTEHIASFTRSFRLIAPEGSRFHGSGCGVDCDKDGFVDLDKLKAETPVGYENYMEHLSASLGLTEGIWRMEGVQYDIDRKAPRNKYDEAPYVPIMCTGSWKLFQVRDEGVTDYSRDVRVPALGKCDRCARHVVLDSFTNTCDCGADYNMSGQLLADRGQWGEETGESLSDILSIDSQTDEMDIETDRMG